MSYSYHGTHVKKFLEIKLLTNCLAHISHTVHEYYVQDAHIHIAVFIQHSSRLIHDQHRLEFLYS